MTTHSTLLGIRIYDIDTNFIYEMKKNRHKSIDIFDVLPQYTFGNDNDIIESEYYHQFTGLVENEENKIYTFFDIEPLCDNLNYEIDSIGKLEFLNNIKLDFKKIIDIIPHQQSDDIRKGYFNKLHYIIINISYDTNYDNYGGGYDTDVDYKIYGYLDENMNKIIL